MDALKRWTLIGACLGLLCLAPSRSTAYVTELLGGNLMRWTAGSPATIWTDATKTLNWSFNPISFPGPLNAWPSVAEAGAAFQNAFQSFQDVPGSSLKQNRLPNSNGTPASDDGKLEMVLAPNEANDYFGSDITGAFAVTYQSANGATGAMMDADIVFNGDPDSFTWSTVGPSPPGGTNDIEVTQIHEAIHGVGGGHPVYLFAAVWPTGRFPEIVMQDRCLSPDDRVLLRTLYPEAPAFGTINGQVNLSSGGGADRAIVVATDLDGVPHATVVTAANGSYSINVPAGTYSVTVHHNFNLDYNSDINFFNASNFINATTVSGVVVAAGGTATAGAITATAGAPTLFFSGLAVSPNGLGSQTLFLPKNAGGTALFEFAGSTFGAAPAVSFGPGITIGTVTTAGPVVSVAFTVTAGAVAGLRTVEVVSAGERALLPSGVFVLDTGSLALSAGPANPTPASAAPSTVDGPLLQVSLAAGAVEDVRVRRLQFALAGTGPALTNVRLWRDLDANGVVGAGDVRIFSGAAFATNPIAETKTLAPPGNVIFDNLGFSVLAGTSENLLLTADYPAAGTGTFTASLATADITAHGMYYGDVIGTTGSTVSGGTQTMANLAVGSPAQIRTTAGTVIPVGGSTTETQVTLRGVPTSSVGTVGVEVEVKPLGTAFTGTGTVSSANTFASGATVSVNVTGLADQTSYHWRIRALSSSFPPGAWVVFGGNAESAIDFSVDASTTTPPSGLGQFESGGAPAVPLGGAARGSLLLSAINGTNSAGSTVRLEIEVQPAGTAFLNTPSLSSGFGPGGALASANFSGATGDYHWQARTVGLFGAASAWVAFNPAAAHFHLDAVDIIEASAGCVGSVAAAAGIPWMAAGIAAVLLGLSRRRVSRSGATALLVLASAVAAYADVPRRLELAEPSSLKPSRPWGSLEAYTGLLFFDAEFESVGTDFRQREVSDTGTWVLGLEAMVNLHPDWAIGGTVELGMSSDLQMVGIGPSLTWRFAASRTDSNTGRTEMEHRIRIGGLYQTLEIDKSGFGDFDPTFALRAGYDLRIAVADRWAVVLGLEFRHAVWDYSDGVLSGDEELGGSGFLVSVGLAFLP